MQAIIHLIFHKNLQFLLTFINFSLTSKNLFLFLKKICLQKSNVEVIRHPSPGHSFSYTKLLNNFSMKRIKDHEMFDIEKQRRIKNDINTIAKEQDLGGINRYVTDGFLNSIECESLMQFASV